MSKPGSDGVEILQGDLGDREVLYGRRLSFPVWLKNRTKRPLWVRAVSVSLQPDTGWKGDANRMVFRSEPGLELPPDHKEVTRVSVIPPLDCLPNSNIVDVSVEYGTLAETRDGDLRQTDRRHVDWILVTEVPAPVGAEVFVSFKDPENEELAQLAAKYLCRAGLTPYLARDDGRCGCDYWREKIEPAIGRAAGTLVIWTADTRRHPEAVSREIGIAQRARVPLGLFLSRDVKAPVEYPPSVLEYFRFDPVAPHAAFAVGIADMARRWRETGQCF
jgi:hypothetical protein